MAGLGRGKKDGRWRVEAGARRGNGSAGNIIVSDAVEGTPVDLDGESRHEHVEVRKEK